MTAPVKKPPGLNPPPPGNPPPLEPEVVPPGGDTVPGKNPPPPGNPPLLDPEVVVPPELLLTVGATVPNPAKSRRLLFPHGLLVVVNAGVVILFRSLELPAAVVVIRTVTGAVVEDSLVIITGLSVTLFENAEGEDDEGKLFPFSPRLAKSR